MHYIMVTIVGELDSSQELETVRKTSINAVLTDTPVRHLPQDTKNAIVDFLQSAAVGNVLRVSSGCCVFVCGELGGISEIRRTTRTVTEVVSLDCKEPSDKSKTRKPKK